MKNLYQVKNKNKKNKAILIIAPNEDSAQEIALKLRFVKKVDENGTSCFTYMPK